MKPVYVIEHLEPELWEWCLIEYKHMAKMVGKEHLWFTNIKKKDVKKLEPFGKVSTESLKNIELKNACLLDPEAPSTLNSKEAKGYDYFIFGGILGDHPPRKRTQEELTPFIKYKEIKNIGKEQLSTDNAVFVVNEIVKGKELRDIPFKDGIEIQINKIESTLLPFRYPLVKGKPNISKELIRYIKKDNKI